MLESQGENGSFVASPLNQSRGLRLAAEQSRPDSHGLQLKGRLDPL